MEYRILGPIDVLGAGGERADLGGPKQRALLALLLCEAGRVVSLDRIIDELWGEEPPPTATGTLQAYVSVLRRALEPNRKPRQQATILQTVPPGYRLSIEDGELDVHRFERFLTSAQELLAGDQIERADRSLGQALSLWRGDPLADVAHERFAQTEIVRLSELRYAALEARAEAQLMLGRHALVIPELERLIAEHPLREGLRARLILALYQAGRQAEALQAYQETRTMLADELGIDPSPELQQLEADILSQAEHLRLRPRQPLLVAEPPASVEEPGRMAPVDERPFVGRRNELEAMQRAVARARDGAGALVLVSGEAGIGKTRLVEAALEHARSLGMAVMPSACSEDQTAMSFWPWIQVARAAREFAATVGEDVSALRTILATDVRGTIEDLEDPVEAEAARFRFYEQITRDIKARTAKHPAVFVFEDLHWADRSSLHLLRYVVPRLVEMPLLVIATYRSEEIDEMLDETLARLTRAPNVERIHLGGLGVHDIADYLVAVGTRTDGGLPIALRDRTDGNPFYLIELVRLLTSEGLIGGERSVLPHGMLGLPLGVQDVVRRRIARLPEDTRAIIGAASVAGRVFPVELIAEATAIDLDQALDLLEPALITRILTEDDTPGLLRFSHALAREAVRASLPPLQRARLHLRVGEALERRYAGSPDAPVTELAHHFWHAMTVGGAPRALAWSMLAARRATAGLAYDEAVQHWTDALAAAELAAPGDVATRMDILAELGLALRRNGDVAGGWARIEEAIGLAAGTGEHVRAVQAATSFGGIDLWNWRDYGEVNHDVVALLERALEQTPADAPELLPRVHATLAVELAYGDRRVEGEEHGRTAIALTREAGDPLTRARALNAFFLASWRPGTEDERLRAMDEYLGLTEHMSGEIEMVGRLHRLFLRLRAGDVDGFDADLARIRALAPTIRDPDLRAQELCVEIMRATLHERWEDVTRAEERLDEVRASTSLWGYEWVRAVQRLTLARLGAPGAAPPDHFDQLDPAPATAELLRPVIALGLLEAGRVDEARRIVAIGEPVVRHDWAWEFTSVAWGEIAAALGTPDPAASYELLTPLADTIVVAGTCIACWGSMHSTLGRLAAALGRHDDAQTHLRAALEVDRSLRAPGLEARTRVALARVEQRAEQGT